jgi:hypothetical protein
VSKAAHAGMPVILKTKLSPSTSFADGVKFSASPTLIVAVLPEIDGAEFCTTVTGAAPPPLPPHELTTSNNIKSIVLRFKIVRYGFLITNFLYNTS